MFFGNVKKEEIIEIRADKVGLVTAKIGANLPPRERFGKTVECQNFQNDRAFIRNGGQKGKQRATLTSGTYRINTELFSVEIVNVIHIPEDEIGLVEAIDGTSLPLGQVFGKKVECNNFENAQAFVDNGGQCGKQLAILLPQTYRINTNIFQITLVKRTLIQVDQIGLVTANIGKTKPVGRNFGKKVECDNFEDGQAFLDNEGESGEQIAILTPHIYSINTWLFEVRTAPVTKIPVGEIGLVIANDGATIPNDRQLGQVVECKHFEDPQSFFDNGGESGRQLAILRDGKTYQINTSLFTIITSANAEQYDLKPEQLKIYVVDKDKIGIVTTLEGKTLPEGEIAGSKITSHESFQKPQKFIEAGGYKGLQEEFLSAGPWVLNPWFVEVEQVPLVEISTNCVGVVISYVGQPANSHSQLVEDGCKGIQLRTLSPGTHPINTKIKKVYQVPTNEIILKWSQLQNDDNPFTFEPLRLYSQDGFIYELELFQTIYIEDNHAPHLILKIRAEFVNSINLEEASPIQVSSDPYSLMEKFVADILRPIIYNSFQFAAHEYESDKLKNSQKDIERQAEQWIQDRLNPYKVKSNLILILKLDQVPHDFN